MYASSQLYIDVMHTNKMQNEVQNVIQLYIKKKIVIIFFFTKKLLNIDTVKVI